MSIRIIKQGFLDTVQDVGRYGWQHIGVNPGGVLDVAALAVANMLVGNQTGEAAIEMYYPCASIMFEREAIIAISGAETGAAIQGVPVPINTPLVVAAGTVLESTGLKKGCCCYLAVKGGLVVDEWAGSCSTNTTVGAGGYKGRKLLTGDVIAFKQQALPPLLLADNPFIKLGWRADVAPLYTVAENILICPGQEYHNLDEPSRMVLVNTPFTITPQSDRMGCRLHGLPLLAPGEEMVSAGVTRGTVQLLPSGQLVVLMAAHQTTGGYPRIAHVITASMPALAQIQTGKNVNFALVAHPEAEALLLAMQQYLLQLQQACKLRLEEYLYNHAHH